MANRTKALGSEPTGSSTNGSPISYPALLGNELYSVSEIACCTTTTVYAELQQKTALFSVPNDVLLSLSAEALQDWVWENCKDELRSAITFKRSVVVVVEVGTPVVILESIAILS